MTNPLRGEVDFPEGGDGVVLRCRPGDLASLETALAGKIPVEGQRVSLHDIYSAINGFSAVAIIASVQAFAKKADGSAAKINVDAVDLTMAQIANRCLDAISLGVHGKTNAEVVREMVAMMEAARMDPTPVPPDGSEN